MINAINYNCRQHFQKTGKECNLRLIRFNGNVGIVKCSYSLKDSAIQILQSIKKIALHEVKIEPLATSGTIRSLLKKQTLKSLIKQ